MNRSVSMTEPITPTETGWLYASLCALSSNHKVTSRHLPLCIRCANRGGRDRATSTARRSHSTPNHDSIAHATKGLQLTAMSRVWRMNMATSTKATEKTEETRSGV